MIAYEGWTGRHFGIAPDDPYIHVIRFCVWSFVAILSMISCIFAMELYVHYIKYSWIKQIYTLLQIIKERETRTAETLEKVDRTSQKVTEKADKLDEKAAKIQETVIPLIESNQSMPVIPPKVEVEIKQNDTSKATDNC